jgi:hypothetical protein
MDKAVYDKKGNFLRWQKRWKIPIPYQKFINEIALVFLIWQASQSGSRKAKTLMMLLP